jgi:sortase A
MKRWEVIYDTCAIHPNCLDHGVYRLEAKRGSLWDSLNSSYTMTLQQVLGFAFLALGLGGIFGPLTPTLRLETAYAIQQVSQTLGAYLDRPTLPQSAPVVVAPLMTPDGSVIEPVNEEFAVIVPKIGINASVTAGVDPSKPEEYQEALKTGVAHASTSFLPSENGTVYLFSHSTNYDWFVKDLNAVFYLLKNLEDGDTIVVIHKGVRYTYKITGKKVVSPSDVTYLYPYIGQRNLILQTCWPPGSVAQRLLIFADLVEENGKSL